MTEHFIDRLLAAIEAKHAPVCVGIDPVAERLPEEFATRANSVRAAADRVEAFGRSVIDSVAPLVPAVKINSAFFEAFYEFGVAAFYRLIEHAHERGLLVIADVKRGDIGSTARLYAQGHLAPPAFADVAPQRIPDAVTLAGYLGAGAVRPFIEIARATGRGLFVLVRPSDPGADRTHEFGEPRRFYQHMADLVREWGAGDGLIGARGFSCVGAVVAPKDAHSTRALRDLAPQTFLLVPGFGAQGADAEACRACFRADGVGAIVNASRSVIYAFERADLSQRCGADWRACVAHAARELAAEMADVLA